MRLVGQDSRRGTFGQRHAVLVDRHTAAEYTPLKQLDSGPAKFFVHDSLLSEYAAMGFEYGYSVARPEALVCWEAQFGDFVNGAQIIIDEFISSGEQKWGQRSGVVLLLPHGYDGQGPDHSSARIERFLSLCAQDNMTVAMPTTPGNYFHLLRWQGLSGRHKPLIVFTPKSMLRLKAAASAVSEFTTGSFRPLIGSTGGPDAGVRRVLLCTGKVYYDLAARRQQTGATDIAIVRVERLYPLPVSELCAELARYPGAESVTWVQEEPANHGRLADLRAQAPAAPGARGGRGVAAAQFRARGGLGGPARRVPHRAAGDGDPVGPGMYFTDRGIEELADRRGDEQVTVAWLAERLRDFVDLNPGFETAVDRLATWLARLDDEEDL